MGADVGHVGLCDCADYTGVGQIVCAGAGARREENGTEKAPGGRHMLALYGLVGVFTPTFCRRGVYIYAVFIGVLPFH